MGVQTTANKTKVLDPLAGAKTFEALPMVVVYRGLGPETGPSYNWDTADWMILQIKNATPKELLSKAIFVVPDDYRVDCGTCLHQAEQLIGKNRIISFYSLCGFSRGGECVYKYLSLRAWRILGLIDPVSPTMEGYKNDVVDKFASSIRCVYNIRNWGKPPKEGKRRESLTKGEKNYETLTTFYDHLKKDLNVKMVDATDVRNPDTNNHADMPALFFKTYGRDLTQ